MSNYSLRALAKFLYEHCALNPDQAGDVASLILSEYDVKPLAPLAQRIEHEPSKLGVEGSNPSGRAKSAHTQGQQN